MTNSVFKIFESYWLQTEKKKRRNTYNIFSLRVFSTPAWILTGTNICLQWQSSIASCSMWSDTEGKTFHPAGMEARWRFNSLLNSFSVNTKCFLKVFVTNSCSSDDGVVPLAWSGGLPLEYPLTEPLGMEEDVSIASTSVSPISSCWMWPPFPAFLASRSFCKDDWFSWARSWAIFKRCSPLTWMGSGKNRHQLLLRHLSVA